MTSTSTNEDCSRMVVCADLGCSGCCARLPEIRNEARSRPGAPGTVYFISGAFILLLTRLCDGANAMWGQPRGRDAATCLRSFKPLLGKFLGLNRKREWARCAHEQGEVARFGFSELKEAAQVAADAGAMQIQLRAMHRGHFFGALAAFRPA